MTQQPTRSRPGSRALRPPISPEVSREVLGRECTQCRTPGNLAAWSVWACARSSRGGGQQRQGIRVVVGWLEGKAELGHPHRASEIFAGAGLVLDETMTLNRIGDVCAQALDLAQSTKQFRTARRARPNRQPYVRTAPGSARTHHGGSRRGRPDEATRLVDQAHTLHAGYRPVPRQTVRRRETSGARR